MKIDKTQLTQKEKVTFDKIQRAIKKDKKKGEEFLERFTKMLQKKKSKAVKSSETKKTTKTPKKPQSTSTTSGANQLLKMQSKDIARIEKELGVTKKEATRIAKSKRKNTKGKSESVSQLIERFKKQFAIPPHAKRDFKKDAGIPAKTAVKRKSPTYGKAGGAKKPYYYEYRMNRRDNSKVPAYLEEGGEVLNIITFDNKASRDEFMKEMNVIAPDNSLLILDDVSIQNMGAKSDVDFFNERAKSFNGEFYAKGGVTKGQTLAENFNLNDKVKNVEFWNNDVIVQDKDGKVKRIDLDKGERISLNAKGGNIPSSMRAIESILKDSGFNAKNNQPKNALFHNRGQHIAVITDGKVYMTRYTPNTKRYLDSKILSSMKEVREYLDNSDLYAKGGEVEFAKGGDIEVLKSTADALEKGSKLHKKQSEELAKASSAHFIQSKELDRIAKDLESKKMAEGGETRTKKPYIATILMENGGEVSEGDKIKTFDGQTFYVQNPDYSDLYMWVTKEKDDDFGYTLEKSMVKEVIMEEGGETRTKKPYIATILMEDGGSIDIANTILQQMGGMRRLIMFTGAKNFVALPNGVSFRIGNRSINYVRITLNAKDLYDMEFALLRGGKMTNKKEYNDIYNDQLRPIFEEATGMYLSFEEGGDISIDDLVFVEPEDKDKFLTGGEIIGTLGGAYVGYKVAKSIE